MANTGFKVGGVDLGQIYLTQDRLDEYYPSLASTLKGAKLYVAGINSSTGVLGLNSQPVASTYTNLQQYGTETSWKQVAIAYEGVYGGYTAAIKNDGSLWVWGQNFYGQLGTNNTTWYSSPVQTVAGGNNWKQVACNGGSMAAIKTDGTLWVWGLNTYGQLGTSNITSYSSPVQTIAGGTSWKQVSMSPVNVAAIKNDGTLWTWGFNSYGQLGDNTTVNKSVPVQTVAGGTNWKQVSAGGNCMSAIKTDGTLWSWGFNSNGQLADNTFVHKSSPVQTIAGGTNWKQVSATSGNAIRAIKTDGTLWTWGNGSNYALGLNDTNVRLSPVQLVSGGTNWYKLGSGLYGAAITNTGEAVVWGYPRARAFYTELYSDSTVTSGSFLHTEAYASRSVAQFAGRFWRDISVDAFNVSFFGIVDNSFTTNP